MENPILAALRRQGLACPPGRMDPLWLLTLLTVQEVGRYPLSDWNEALSAVLGRRICCPSYQTLARYLQRVILEVK